MVFGTVEFKTLKTVTRKNPNKTFAQKCTQFLFQLERITNLETKKASIMFINNCN